MSRAELQLLHRVRDNVLHSGFRLSDPASHVHCRRMAKDEGTFVFTGVPRNNPESIIFRSFLGIGYQRSVLHVAG